MPRAHRLKPLVLSNEEVFHAYTSPPISEKSGLPTLIVTPAEPVSASDFHIHFFSPEPTKVSFFQRAKKGIRHYFVPPPPSPLKLEDEAQVVEIKPKIWRPVSPLRTVEYAYSAVPTEEVQSPPPTGEIRLYDDSDDEDMESGMLGSEQQSLFRSSMSLFSTKRVRIGLCLALPLAAVAFHVVSHQLGMFGTMEDGVDISQ